MDGAVKGSGQKSQSEKLSQNAWGVAENFILIIEIWKELNFNSKILKKKMHDKAPFDAVAKMSTNSRLED